MNISQAEILFGELKEINECPEAFLTRDFDDRMYELLQVIKKDPEQIEDITYIIENNRLREGFCPKCGVPLKNKSHLENQGECRGIDAFEQIFEDYCENCGWTENN